MLMSSPEMNFTLTIRVTDVNGATAAVPLALASIAPAPEESLTQGSRLAIGFGIVLLVVLLAFVALVLKQRKVSQPEPESKLMTEGERLKSAILQRYVYEVICCLCHHCT